MKKNHLTYFKVENFKKFESLEINDIGQFNLIVGDNNVGKTCLLEALLFDEDGQQLLNNFYLALTKRGLKFEVEKRRSEINGEIIEKIIQPKNNYFKEYIIRKDSRKLTFDFKSNTKNGYFSISTSENLILEKLHPLDDGIFYSIYDYNLKNLNFPLISFNDSPLEVETRNIYENLKTKKEKQTLVDILKVVSPNIVDIELRENFDDLKSVFLISFKDKDEFVPLNFLGDGFKRIFYIILKIISLKGKRIMIDEIEIGVHHSKLKDFWINVFKVCKELDVQLFATTHSNECIEDYVEAANEVKLENEVRMIHLQEYDKKMYASTYDFENIKSGIFSNSNLRG